MKLWSETILPGSNQKAGNYRKPKSDIVFLHGTGSNARMWKNQVSYFSQLGYACTIVDLRGHGQSHEPYEKTDLEIHRQDILQTLQNGNVRFPAYFVGHSLGAIISLAIAEKHPELVRGIFAACLPGKVLKPVSKAFAVFINGPMQALKESELKRFLGWREQTLVEMHSFTLKEIITHFGDLYLLNQLPEVNCPVHLACWRFDPIALYWHAHDFHKKIPSSTLKTFEWGGHNFMDTRSTDFNDLIFNYLE